MKKVTIKDIAVSSVFAAIIAVCSLISVPLAVPFTMQTFAIFLTARMLNVKCATLSVVIYLTLGLFGLPVFSGFRGGPSVLFTATGGFLIGFLVMTPILSLLFRRFKGFSGEIFTGIIGLLICYISGALWFALVFSPGASFGVVFMTAVAPFILPDIIKVFASKLVADRLSKIKI